MPTMKEIGVAAGVSLTTVSKVLNNNFTKVSDETKNRILSIAEEMNYRPNRIARMLAKKESKIIGLMIPDITNPYYAQVAKGAMDICEANGYKVFVGNTAIKHEKETDFIQAFNEYGADGIILYGGGNYIKETGIHNYVTINSLFRGSNCVYVDEIKGTYGITQYVISRGHKNIAFIGSGNYQKPTDNHRYSGYLNALNESGIGHDESLIKFGDYTYESGYTAAVSLLGGNTGFTAIICANDMIAFGAMKAIRESGKKVPEDISITGYDDVFFSSVITPALTTVRQPAYLLGSAAMEMLLKIIKGINDIHEICYTPEIIIRDSVRKISL